MTLRVPKAEVPELRDSMIDQFGVVPEPLEVTWHNRKVAMAAAEFGAKVSERDTADESLKSFAHMAVAAQVGCSWCLDFGYFQAQNENLDMAKASQVPRWRESDVFTALERDVLEYAEAMTRTPLTVTDSCRPGCWTGSALAIISVARHPRRVSSDAQARSSGRSSAGAAENLGSAAAGAVALPRCGQSR